MMYWGNGYSLWAMLFMALGNLLFLALIVTGIVLLVRYLGRTGPGHAMAPPPPPPPPAAHRPTPQQVLADRFARGEIDEEEYHRRLQVLAGAPPRPTSGEG